MSAYCLDHTIVTNNVHAVEVAGRSIARPARPDVIADRGATVLDTVPPLPDEETLYGQFRVPLDCAGRDDAIKTTLLRAASGRNPARRPCWPHSVPSPL